MKIDVWSDFVCPFCYMGEALLQQALKTYDGEVSITYHSYQLMPELAEDTAINPTDLFVQERGMDPEQAAAANAQVTQRAATLGLQYRLDQALAVNTRTAHRLSHFAAEHGKQHQLVRALFDAYFTQGLNLREADTLADIAAQVGLDRERARAVVVGDDYSQQVEADIQQAQRLQISGVPFFVFNERLAVSGAQPVEVFQQALQQASRPEQR